MSTSPAGMRSTIVGSPSGPRPAECLRTTVTAMPLRRSTVGGALGGEDLEAELGQALDREDDRALVAVGHRDEHPPAVGSPPNAAACDLANACGKSTSKPMTSPVERISGPSTVSTTMPSAVRNRLNGSTASLTASGAPRSQRAAVALGRQHALGAQVGDRSRRP